MTETTDAYCCGVCCGAMSPKIAQDWQCGLGIPDWVTCADCLDLTEGEEDMEPEL